MKNRLEIARELLTDDGYNLYSDLTTHEQAYLKVLMDSIFGRNQYVNTVSVLFKNIAGASGGGQDKRLQKNIEYVTIYSKNRELSRPFNSVYEFKKISNLVQEMREEGVSWKYTSHSRRFRYRKICMAQQLMVLETKIKLDTLNKRIQ